MRRLPLQEAVDLSALTFCAKQCAPQLLKISSETLSVAESRTIGLLSVISRDAEIFFEQISISLPTICEYVWRLWPSMMALNAALYHSPKRTEPSLSELHILCLGQLFPEQPPKVVYLGHHQHRWGVFYDC